MKELEFNEYLRGLAFLDGVPAVECEYLIRESCHLTEDDFQDTAHIDDGVNTTIFLGLLRLLNQVKP